MLASSHNFRMEKRGRKKKGKGKGVKGGERERAEDGKESGEKG